MKKTILTLLAITLILPGIALAETASSTLKKEGREDWREGMVNLREKIRQERENLRTSSSSPKNKELKDDRKILKENIKSEIKDLRSQRVGIFADHLLQRISLQIKNLENLLARTNAKTQEIANSGKDVSAIKVKLAEAESSLVATKSEFSLLPTKLDLIRTSTDTQLILEAKNLASSTISKITETHAKIIEAITLIKSISN